MSSQNNESANEALLEVAQTKLSASLKSTTGRTGNEDDSNWRSTAENLLSLTKSVLDLSKNSQATSTMAMTLTKSKKQDLDITDSAPDSRPISDEQPGIYQSAKDHVNNTTVKFFDHASEIVLKFLKLQQIRIKIGKKENKFVNERLQEITDEIKAIEDCVYKAKLAANNKQEQKFLYFLREAMLKTELVDQKMLKDGQRSITKLVTTKADEAKWDALRSLTIGGLSSIALGAGVYFAPQSLLNQSGARSAYIKYWVAGGFAIICAIVTAANLTGQLRKLNGWQREWLADFREVKYDVLDEKLSIDNLKELYKWSVSNADANQSRANLLDNLDKIGKL